MNTAQSLDVRSHINGRKMSGYQWLLLILCFLIVATDGMDVAIVKLGGAALTVKSRRGTIDARGFADCVETVARARARGDGTRVIVAHGAGSFGHGALCEWMTTTRWTDGETVRRTQRRRGRAGARAAATSTGTRRSREGWTRRGVKCEN